MCAVKQVGRDFAAITRDVAALRALVRDAADASQQDSKKTEAMTVTLHELNSYPSATANRAHRGARIAADLHLHTNRLGLDAAELARFPSVASETATTLSARPATLSAIPKACVSALARSARGG